MDVLLFNLFRKLYPAVPSKRAAFEAFSLLVSLLGVIFLIDILTPESISFRPLFVIPVLLVGLVDDTNIAICLAFIAASLFAGSIYWNHPEQGLTEIGVNFFVSLSANLIVAKCSLLAARSISLLSKLLIDYQAENLALKQRSELQQDRIDQGPHETPQ